MTIITYFKTNIIIYNSFFSIYKKKYIGATMFSGDLNHIKLIWKLIKSLILHKKPVGTYDKAKYKLEKEECTGFLIIIIMMGFANVFEFCLGTMKLVELAAFSFILMFLLFCIKKAKIKFMKNMFCIIISIIPSFWISYEQSYVLAIQVSLIIMPSICLALTRCFNKSLIVWISNLIQSIMLVKPKIMVILNLEDDIQRNKIITPLISVSFTFGLVMLVVLWVLLDSRKKMMAKINEQKNSLVKTNESLVQSLKIREEFQTLLLSVVHELKNPMNVIVGSAQLGLLIQQEQVTKQYFENVYASSELITYLINNLLDCGKMQKTELEIVPKVVNKKLFIERLWRACSILISRRSLYGSIFVSKNIPEDIEIDQMRILQIIYNLTTNAAKFTQKGYISIVCTWIDKSDYDKNILKPTEQDFFRQYMREKKDHKTFETKIAPLESHELNLIDHSSCEIENSLNLRIWKLDSSYFDRVPKTISYKNFFDKYDILDLNNLSLSNVKSKKFQPSSLSREGFLKIEVIDSGCGINEKDAKNLFEQFSQVGPSSQKQLGTGLGLWISKKLCQKMHGDLVLHSQINKGSIFIAIIRSVPLNIDNVNNICQNNFI